MRALANAKVNLSLRVDGLREDGFHTITSLFQSVSLADRLELEPVDGADGIFGWEGGAVPDGDRNLAWRAVEAVRTEVALADPSVGSRPLRLRLAKRIPVAAGMGGGSADAAAALHLAVGVLGTPPAVDGRALVGRLALSLGSDVPFCVQGGTAMVTGRGEIVHPMEPLTGFALGLVVPPVELATPAVFSAWDRRSGAPGGRRRGVELGPSGLPPSLRDHAPLYNDLYPAAVSLAPAVDEWRRELETVWGRPVAMSGSGPTLFALFVDLAEATAAGGVVPPGARSIEAVEPVAAGWSWDRGEDR